MIALLTIAAVAFVLFVVYCRGHEHGVMECEMALRKARASEPPTPAALDDQRMLAPEAARDTFAA